MGTEQSKEKTSKKNNSDVTNKKNKLHSNATFRKVNSRKVERVSRNNSITSEDNSDNESFSLIVKHKTQNSNLKRGILESNTNFIKTKSSDLDWDSIVKIIDVDVNQGIVIIEDSNK